MDLFEAGQGVVVLLPELDRGPRRVDVDLDEIVVTPKKVAGLTVVSNELLADAAEDAASLIGALVNSLRRKIDVAYFSASTTNGPAGLPSVVGQMYSGFTSAAGGFGPNLDSFVDQLTSWVTAPQYATVLSKIKEQTGSAKGLLQPDPTQPTRRLVGGVPVIVSPGRSSRSAARATLDGWLGSPPSPAIRRAPAGTATARHGLLRRQHGVPHGATPPRGTSGPPVGIASLITPGFGTLGPSKRQPVPGRVTTSRIRGCVVRSRYGHGNRMRSQGEVSLWFSSVVPRELRIGA